MIDINSYNKFGTKVQILERNETGFGLLIEQDAGYISKSLNNDFINESFVLEDLKPMQPILINCILQKWGVENRNGRIYPKEVLLPQVNLYQELVDANSAISECDHPSSSVISLQNISHMVKKMWWGTGDNENVLFGQLRLIVSPGFIKLGICSTIGDKILLYLMHDIRLGISSRGIGSLKQIQGKNIVQNDFELVGFDLVSTPSTFGAYLFPDKNELNIGETTNKQETYNKPENTENSYNKKLSALNKFLGK